MRPIIGEVLSTAKRWRWIFLGLGDCEKGVGCDWHVRAETNVSVLLRWRVEKMVRRGAKR